LALILLSGLAVPLSAQSNVSGSIQGTVKDADGGVLPGVTVTAFSDALVKGKQVAITDERGVYRFPSLPPGAYVIEAELAGFQTVRQENLRARLGQAIAVDMTMPLTAVAEQVTVTGDAPLVSVVSNDISTSIDKDFLDRQPVSRSYYALVNSVPGANGLTLYGSTQQRQNAFTLDGVNVADPASGEYWLLPSIQWMEEIQIGGMGANAEYGNYTGGIVNAVTKSGGNEFHGGIEAYYEPDSWVATNDPSGEQQEYSLEDYSLSLGGAMLKDKLWFFVSGEYYRQKTTPVGAEAASDRTVPRYLGKLTYQLSEANRFMVMAEHDAVLNENRWIDEYTKPSGAAKQDGPNQTFAGSWEGLLNASNFVSVKLTGFDGRDDYLPYSGWDTPGRYDDYSGYYWGNVEAGRLQHRQRLTFDAAWSLFADGLFGGSDSHAFKFGANYENSAIGDDWKRPGGFTYYDDSYYCDSEEAYFADPTCARWKIRYGTWTSSDEYYTRAVNQGVTFYAQDSARLGPVTINAGLRYSQFEGGFEHGKTDVYKTDFLDPRLGLAWDVFGNSKTAVKAHWGRYHMAMFTYLYDRETSGASARPAYECYWNEDTNAYDDCDEPVTQAADLDRDHGHQYVDETLLSFEQELGKDMSIGVDLIDRRTREIMAMINVNDDYTLWTIDGNPFGGGSLPVWNLESQPEFVLTTDNGAYRDYQSVVLRFDKRYSHGWMLRASLVWADLEGNIYSNSGYDVDYPDKNGFTNLSGRMEGYNEWEFKLNGSVDLPLNLQLAAFYTYRSGEYWTPYVRIYGLDYNNTTGNYIYLTERGSQQLPDRHLVDLRLGWSTKLSSGIKLGVSLEGFNVLNSDTELDVGGRWGYYDFDDEEEFIGPRSSYGKPTSIENPREIRLGVRFEF
jgi:hypothetical protein